MYRKFLRCLCASLLFVCSVFLLKAQNQPRSITDEETALRTLAEKFYATYAQKDLAGFFRLWSEKSPELAARRQAMPPFFANYAQIEVKELTIRHLALAGETARLRVSFAVHLIEAQTGRPAPTSGQRIRVLHCAKEEGQWKVWRELAAAEELAARLSQARNEGEQAALLAAEKELVTGELSRELNRQGWRAFLQGNNTEALFSLRLAERLASQIGDQPGRATALNFLGILHNRQGNPSASLEYFQQSLALREALRDQAGLSDVLSNLGVSHRLLGNYSEALDSFQRSLALTNDQRGIAYTLGNLANVALDQGNYSLALDYARKAMAMLEALKDEAALAQTLNNIGAILDTQGSHEAALEYYQKGLKLHEQSGRKEMMADTLVNIGVVYSAQGKSQEALKYYQQSLGLSESLQDQDGLARGLNNIGLVHLSQGNARAAFDHFSKSLALTEASDDKAAIAQVLSNLGRTYLLQRDYAQSLAHAERATILARQIGSPALLAAARTLAGQSRLALGQSAAARAALEEAIATTETIRDQVAGGEQEQQLFFAEMLAPYYTMLELLVAQNQPSEALAYAERAKARVLLDVLHHGRINIAKAMTAQEREQEQRLRNQLVSLNLQLARENRLPKPDAARLNELKAQQQKARRDFEAFQINLYAAHPELKGQRGQAEPLTIEQAGALLPDAQSALLEFAVTEEKTYLFVVTKAKTNPPATVELKVYPLALKRPELAERVARFRTALAQGDLSFRPGAHELYDLLLQPAAAQLQGKTALVIVPDGALWDLPFQALQSAPNRSLLAAAAIAYAPSLTALREMSQRRSPKTASRLPTLLAFGNPSLGQQTLARAKSVLLDEKLAPLPEAERQVNLMRQIYGATQSKIYLGAEAREGRAKTEAGAYRILHLATHGLLNDRSPLYSHVLLASAESNGKESEEDGLLEAWEIMKLDLQAELAVLSACETARGRIGAGEGIIGLSWALFVAGCPTTVVSQWKVEAASTTELMLEFHRQLKTQMAGTASPLSAARALREAALKLQRRPAYRHPFYWAGFVVTGKGF